MGAQASAVISRYFELACKKSETKTNRAESPLKLAAVTWCILCMKRFKIQFRASLSATTNHFVYCFAIVELGTSRLSEMKIDAGMCESLACGQGE